VDDDESDSGLVEPVNLFGKTGDERFEDMFANPSSSNSQAASSGAKGSSQSVATPAAEAEGIADSHPAPAEAEPIDIAEHVVEAVVEAAPAVEANAEEALCEAAPAGSRRPTGPRGPNVHMSPTTLAELAPPGCSITLNSNLALGFVLSLVLHHSLFLSNAFCA